MQYLDMKTYLPGDILVKVDRAGMAHSLEVRMPFLDHQLIEWVSRLPPWSAAATKRVVMPRPVRPLQKTSTTTFHSEIRKLRASR